jgi:hypothetical protein
MKSQFRPFAWIVAFGLLNVSIGSQDWQPLPVADDPLVRMPGTQPEQGATIEGPRRCLNCHGDYNTSVEPGFNWEGSMMAQAARDFIFWSCMTVAGQDSIWVLGNPNALDLCERCHFPRGWLAGRSDPPNATLMTGADYDGVQCDFCHTMYDPFFATTHSGDREGSDWLNHWDETNLSDTPSQAAADATLAADTAQAQALTLFNSGSFYEPNAQGQLIPFSPAYTENGSGQFFVTTEGDKRASFADAAARHQMLYSRHHKSRYFCGSCHDVSNPVLANLLDDPTQPLTTESQSANSYFHVERTFSEFMLSAYGQLGGAPGIGPFAPDVYETSLANNNISRCQDCHMRDVIGQGCNKQGVPVRPLDSLEHPQSGQPLHDLTGGNMFVPYVLASTVTGSPNYDSLNDQLLNQGAAALTLDLTQGEGLDSAALLAGVDRAHQQLQLAAAIENLTYDASTGALSFRIQNQTGHRLISGFPEGRRMFINIRAYDSGGALIYEVNPYDDLAGTLKGLGHTYDDPDGTLPPLPDPQPLSATEVHEDALVYEVHPSSNLTGEDETFHFVLADGRWKDNRIPPKGFRIAEAAARVSVPVWEGVESPDLFTAAEYAGGYDDVTEQIVAGASAVEVLLYYQTTSREYMEFLRDEIRGTGHLTLADPSPFTGLPAYRVQSDPFFSQLAAWGDTIWKLWKHGHQRGVLGAAPVLMAQASVGGVTPCAAPTPTLLSAVPGHSQITITWTDEHAGDPDVTGYEIYYDQAGKAQLITAVDQSTTSYTDTGLTNGQEYCYKVLSVHPDGCQSSFSNVLCATATNQAPAEVGAEALETGRYETTGRGKNKTTIFVSTDIFSAGDAVVLRAHVVDPISGFPVEGAVVDIAISGPESATLITAPSDAAGVAEAQWNTQAPNKKGNGGTTPGSYAAAVTGISADARTWDGVMTSAGFTIN